MSDGDKLRVDADVDPVRECYDVVSGDPEIQAMAVILACLRRRGLNWERANRIMRYLTERVADEWRRP